MSDHPSSPAGPDFRLGVPLADIPEDRPLVGHIDGEAALLVRQGERLHALGASCPHYGAPLAEGLIVGDSLRCPWHHACFRLHDGKLLGPPALDDLPCWEVQCRDGKAYVGAALPPPVAGPTHIQVPKSVLIVGGGAAGNAAALTLRHEGYEGAVTLLSADATAPYDRPNLSKDYLAGSAEPGWLPLRSKAFYAGHSIGLRTGVRVERIDPAARTLTLAGGERLDYGALILATGSTAARLQVPGAELPHVHTLRSLADCDALIAACAGARRCVLVGAGFIGLEAAASLRSRGLEVQVVAPSPPLRRVLGEALGGMLQALHEQHGVVFHIGAEVQAIEPGQVRLADGRILPADLVLVGVGARPELGLAEAAGLRLDKGVLVDAWLRCSAPDIYAVGDIARWPDARSGAAIRVEHWAVAERQGVVAALNILGRQQRYTAVPFFWTQQYDIGINYVGHAEQWDRVDIDGDPARHDCRVSYWLDGRRLAVATVGRDLESLRAEADFEAQRPA
ncbi:FAD-dependent oxidoreductase [Pseudomonas citronellolis]|uniref:FAD-dependent oxidoreductase n=1 Tax=Pseudomonas citronellolis TaxID=53408 RepID=UPI0023E44FF4|nr:FAD-dependent oxidoreductase [Pseudomonas citronellolis]MDF3936713.1 FAD-dependent oxidoreductase [Pseudomonas citronellolis]